MEKQRKLQEKSMKAEEMKLKKDSPTMHAESLLSSSDENILEHHNNSLDNLETKNPQTAMIRGKPKLTKPAPPVVAIRMADLMHDKSENDESEKDMGPSINVEGDPPGEEPASAYSKKVSKPPVEDKKLKKESEKK